MEIKEVLGLIAVVLAISANASNIFGIFKGYVKPHLLTYLVWTITTSIAFAGSWVSGGAAGSWSLGANSFLVIVVFVLCFRYGTRDVTLADTGYFIAACLALVPWMLTNDPTISVVSVTVVDVLGYLPMLRKTWRDPDSELALVWSINSLKHGIALMAIGNVALATVVYPAALLLMNGIFAGEILLRRTILRRP